MGNPQVLVLNSDRRVLHFCDWQRAVMMMLNRDEHGRPQAYLFEGEPGRTVNSPSVSVPFPKIVRLREYHYLPNDVRLEDPSDFATATDILTRDRRTCAYCGERGETLDHVFPSSRGGGSTWDNLVACCHACNNRKGDRTPEEAQMPLRRRPHRPERYEALQQRIWQLEEPEPV